MRSIKSRKRWKSEGRAGVTLTFRLGAKPPRGVNARRGLRHFPARARSRAPLSRTDAAGIPITDENESTTLGREGSDYSAAVFAYMLDAESVSIWKDVKGVMNADPKQFADAQFISELNYDEVIEMAYYGAQVIHPKTIKPLQNKNIPLYVKCFADASLPGTVIHNHSVKNLPPIIVVTQYWVPLAACAPTCTW